MSEYNGCYVKLWDNPDYWAVDEGKRRKLSGPMAIYDGGLRRVVRITAEEMEAIPFEGGGNDAMDRGTGDPVE
jgi:hypothetical protein